MSVSTPSIDGLLHIEDAGERALECGKYIAGGEAALSRVRGIRDDAIKSLLEAGVKPSEAARRSGMSLAHIKLVQRLRSGRLNGG